MTVTDNLHALGRWNIQLKPTIPVALRDRLDYFGHVVVTPSHELRPSDELLGTARYVGVVLEVDPEAPEIGGPGLAWHLGDDRDGGRIYTDPVVLNDEPLPDAVRALLPLSVGEGTFHTVAGDGYSAEHRYVSPRTAISRVVEHFGAEWRLRTHPTAKLLLDVGTRAQLYPDGPRALLANGEGREASGLQGVDGDLAVAGDARDWTSDVTVLAQGVGASIAAATASLDEVPYSDLRGNELRVGRVVSESQTPGALAEERAQAALAAAGAQATVRLDIDGGWAADGTLRVGEDVWVHDPVSGLVDPATEVRFAGQKLHPVAIRLVGLTWPVTQGHGVYYRDRDGVWSDLTDHVAWESGATTVELGALPRDLITVGEPVGPRLQGEDDGGVPGQVVVGSVDTGVYVDAEGRTLTFLTPRWSQPDNVDLSPILDGDRYEVDYRPTGGDDWTSTSVGFDKTAARLDGLPVGTPFQVRVRAVDRFGNAGAWSSTFSRTTSADTLPPGTPAAPSVTGQKLSIKVTHTLGLSGSGSYTLPQDLDHLEVHAGTSSGFSPSASTLVGVLIANVSNLASSQPVSGEFAVPGATTRHVKVVAVDRVGNRSQPSAAASVAAGQLADGDISGLDSSKLSSLGVIAGSSAFLNSLTVGTAQIANGAITNAKIGNAAVNTAQIANAAITNAKIESLSADKITGGTITATVSMTSPNISAGPVTIDYQGISITAGVAAQNAIKWMNGSTATTLYSMSNRLYISAFDGVTLLGGGPLATADINAAGDITSNGSPVVTVASAPDETGDAVWGNGTGRTGNPLDYDTYPGAHTHAAPQHTHTISF